MKKRVVVLGAGGFVGSAIIKNLSSDRYEPMAVTRNDCDLSQEASSKVIAGLVEDGDVVVCAAAKAPAKNLEMLCENIAMITHIAEALKGRRLAYVLNISSDAVYADSMEKLSESSTISPLNAHGIMHCMRETILERSLDAPIGHLRPTLIYGAADPHNGYGPNSFLRAAKASQRIDLFGNGEERRDHVCIDDVAKLAVGMIEQKTIGPVNAVSGKVVSFMEIAELVRDASGGAVSIHTKPRSGPMPHNGYRAFSNEVAMRVCPGMRFTELSAYIHEAMA